jgi:MSHA biogenesis protein MshI
MKWFRSLGKKRDWCCVNLLSDRVDLCHVRIGSARPEIVTCDSFRKEGGDVATLERLRREFGLDRYRCTTLLNGDDYDLMQVETPGNLSVDGAKDAVRERLRDRLDYSVDTATVDATFIPDPDGTIGRSTRMLAVAARTDALAARVESFDRAEIALEVIDVPEFAQRNLARHLELEGRALVLLAFGEQGSLLTITCGGELYQSCRLDLPLGAFEGTSEERRKDLCDILASELQRSLDYFRRHYPHLTVGRVMVTPAPGADDLRESLAVRLDVPVALVHLSEIADFPRLPELHEDARQAQCLQLIGAAMRGAPATA